MKHLLLSTIAAVLVVGCNGQFVDRSLVEASEKGDLNKVQQLLDSGADLNVEDYANHTALYHAAEKGHFNIAKLLLEKGAKVNHESGDSALLWACHYGHVDIVKLLIENGANVNAKRSMDDSTPFPLQFTETTRKSSNYSWKREPIRTSQTSTAKPL
ncbi:MAG: ankyrin repeat domain-containing protein [Verrucomicrobia bacterium]|jgi:ankyrin repeat protein|nr:ankyrin repeat domain-containing protein [Verrucomicrobiota bacterium]